VDSAIKMAARMGHSGVSLFTKLEDLDWIMTINVKGLLPDDILM
tara:strand:- start:12 stop:143 length:132 start_codon:yes stop_codon:yes gene_type:complete